MRLKSKFQNEDELVRGLKEKDKDAFRILADMYAGNLLGVISQIIWRHEVAQDALQDILIKIWKSIDSYDKSKGRLFTWMLIMTKNHAVDVTRSKSFRDAKISHSIDNCFRTVEYAQQTEMSVDAIGVKDLLKALTASEKYMVDLIYFKGHTYTETAEILHIPVGTVKTRMRVALRTLREYAGVKDMN